jgi:hypothetical protein
MNDFDWCDDPGILAHSYGDIAKPYANPRGDVVIRQRDEFDTEDAVLIVPLDSADRLADAIREAANDGRAARADLDQQQQPAQQPEEQQRLALPAPQPRPTVTKPREGVRHG